VFPNLINNNQSATPLLSCGFVGVQYYTPPLSSGYLQHAVASASIGVVWYVLYACSNYQQHPLEHVAVMRSDMFALLLGR
jgi:hypothetical protein